MKKLAAWRLLLDGCTAGLVLHGAARAALPPDVRIATPAEAQAFADDAASFVFSGQSLAVDTSFATGRRIELERLAPVIVGPGVHFELNGVVAAGTAPMGAPLEKRGAGALALSGENTYTSNTVLREGTLRLAGRSPLGSATYSLEQHAGTVLHLEPDARLLNFIQLNAPRAGDASLPGLEDRVEWRVESGLATLVNNVNALVPLRKTGEGGLRVAGTVQSRSFLEVLGGALVLDGTMTGRVEVGAGARLEGGGGMAGARIGSGGMVAPGGRDAAGTLSAWSRFVFEPDSLYHVNAYPDGRADRLDLYGDAQLDGRVWAQAGAGEWAPEQRYLILAAEGGIGGTRFAGVDTNLAFLDPSLEYDARNVYLTLRRNDLDVGDVGETPDDRDVGEVIDPPEPPVDPEPPIEPEPPGTETPQPPRPPEPEPPQPPSPPPPPDPQPPAEPESPQPPQQPGGGPGTAEDDTATPDVPASDPPAGPAVVDGGEPPLRETILAMTHDEARSALRQLAGGWHASVRSFLLEDSRYVREAVLASAPPDGGLAFAGRVWGAEGHGGGESGSIRDADGGLGGRHAGYGHDGSRGKEAAEGSGGEAGVRERRVRAWAQGYVAAGRRHAVDGVAGDRHGSRGLVLGLDAAAGRDWRLGGVLAAQHARLARQGVPASASIDSLTAGLAAHGAGGRMRLAAGLLHAWHRIDSRRHVSAGPLQEVLGATYTGRSLQAFMELAPRLRGVRGWGEWLRGAGMEPYLRYAGTWLRVQGFDESGGMAAHHVHASTTRLHTATLGWRWRHGFEHGGRPVRLEADLGWRRVLGNTGVASTQQFRSGTGGAGAGGPPSSGDDSGTAASLSAPFTSRGLPLARNALALGLGMNAMPARNVRVSARYSGFYSGAYRDHAGWVDFRWRF